MGVPNDDADDDDEEDTDDEEEEDTEAVWESFFTGRDSSAGEIKRNQRLNIGD